MDTLSELWFGGLVDAGSIIEQSTAPTNIHTRTPQTQDRDYSFDPHTILAGAIFTLGLTFSSPWQEKTMISMDYGVLEHSRSICRNLIATSPKGRHDTGHAVVGHGVKTWQWSNSWIDTPNPSAEQEQSFCRLQSECSTCPELRDPSHPSRPATLSELYPIYRSIAPGLLFHRTSSRRPTSPSARSFNPRSWWVDPVQLFHNSIANVRNSAALADQWYALRDVGCQILELDWECNN